MDGQVSSFMLQLLQIIWINILLSGDNAVVIALACRGLPPKSRKVGIIAGAGVAIVLRIIFTLLVVSLLAIP
jgi:predicted tellurium resistance membrane protein TerC